MMFVLAITLLFWTDYSVSEAMIKDFAYKNLTRYKCPSHIEFVDDLPKSNVGKVLRQKLREKHLADHA